MSRLARVVLAIVGITVTVASSALPSAAPSIPSATTSASSVVQSDNALPIANTAHDTTASTATAAPAATSVSPGTTSTDQQVYVEVVSATSSTADDVNSVSAADARALVASMDSYWSGESNGAVRIDFAGFETSSLGLASCDPSTVFSNVPTTAFSKQFAGNAWTGTGKHLLILTTESCDSAGQGSVGGNGGIMLSGNGTSTSLSEPVAVHEFGHNLGFGHAGSSICKSNVTTDGSQADYASSTSQCATDEYGDYLDIMGYSVAGSEPHLSTPQRIKSGWLTDYTSVTAASGEVTTTVTPLDGAASNRAVRVVDPNTGAVYYIEYRTPSGRDATSSEFTSAARCTVISGYTKCSGGETQGSVRILRVLPYRDYTDYVRTTVVAVGSTDTTTSRTTHLNIGDTFASSGGGIYVTLNSLDTAAGASVTVRFTPPASTTTSLTLSRKATQAYGATATVAVAATVLTSDGLGAAGTVTFLDGTTTIGYGLLVGGVARLSVPSATGIGTHKLTARYTPATADTTASTADVAKLVVTKSVSKVAISVKKRAAKITVTSATKATGTVRIYADGKRLKTVKLTSGKATVTLPKHYKKIVAKYAGTKIIAAGTASKKAAKRS